MHDGIHLRPMAMADIDAELCRWYDNSDGHLDYFTGSGRTFTKETLIEDFISGANSLKWFYYLIETLEGIRIGTVKIGPIDSKNRTSDLVCLIGNRTFLGKGLASKAIALANRIAFEEHKIRRLHSGMYETNVASIKAYTRAGWYIEAKMKGYYLFNEASVDRVCVACLNPAYFDLATEVSN